MTLSARYAHTNLIAEDWERLAEFYETVFGCERVGAPRDLSEDWLGEGAGIPGARLRGQHLRLPGHGADGPTLEIFQYAEMPPRAPIEVNRPGFGHICFQVDDVGGVRETVLASGGAGVGEVVTADIEGAGRITWCYVTDPEGNVVELQRWFEA